MFKERWYQRRGAKKIYDAVLKALNPVGVFPTGSGKTIIICKLSEKYLDNFIEKDVLILSHRKKILKQDHIALSRHFPGIEIGMYSAGIGVKEKRKITVAGIQSVWRKPELFENVGMVIIDEAHLISHKSTGMYRKFLKNINASCVGLTATPFRLGHGYIYKGEDVLFNHLAYDLSSTESYNKLVAQGYLSPMYSRKTKFLVDTSDIKKKGREFDIASSKEKFDREAITEVACNEIVRVAGENKLKKWLIFAIDIEHAENITKKMINLGVKCACVHSKLKNNDEIMLAYENGEYDCVVNVDILTTGLDIPEIDLIGVLKPTESPALHIQIIGRGGRPVYALGYDLSKRKERVKAIKNGPKPFCMVLDFAGNVNRLGPINAVNIDENYSKNKAKGKGVAITKVCPGCETIVHAATRNCDCCGHKFNFAQKIKRESDEVDLIVKESPILLEKMHEVSYVEYSINSRKGKQSSLLVKYNCKGLIFKEYICIDHGGYARHMANNWIRQRIKHGKRKPKNLSELFKIKEELRVPKKIGVRKNGKYDSVEKCEF